MPGLVGARRLLGTLERIHVDPQLFHRPGHEAKGGPRGSHRSRPLVLGLVHLRDHAYRPCPMVGAIGSLCSYAWRLVFCHHPRRAGSAILPFRDGLGGSRAFSFRCCPFRSAGRCAKCRRSRRHECTRCVCVLTARRSRRPKACSLRSHRFGSPRFARPRLSADVRRHASPPMRPLKRRER